MQKIVILLTLISLTGCVNNRWQVPEQPEKESDTITIIQYTF